MSNPRILIFDDEVSVYKVLSEGVKKWFEDCEIVGAMDGYTALEHIRNKNFDLVVTSFKMAGMDGLELLETIRCIQPATRVILVKVYGNNEIEVGPRRVQAYKYLTTLLPINKFHQFVENTLREVAISRPGFIILSDERYRLVVNLLQDLQGNVGARCVLLVNADGNIVARTGVTQEFPIEQVSSLLGGGLAALLEVGRVINGDVEAIHLAYREGSNECLYAINIGEQLMLLLVTERAPYSSRIGSVWHYARQAAVALKKIFWEADFAGPERIFGENIDTEIDKELKGLFSVNSSGDIDQEEDS